MGNNSCIADVALHFMAILRLMALRLKACILCLRPGGTKLGKRSVSRGRKRPPRLVIASCALTTSNSFFNVPHPSCLAAEGVLPPRLHTQPNAEGPFMVTPHFTVHHQDSSLLYNFNTHLDKDTTPVHPSTGHAGGAAAQPQLQRAQPGGQTGEPAGHAGAGTPHVQAREQRGRRGRLLPHVPGRAATVKVETEGSNIFEDIGNDSSPKCWVRLPPRKAKEMVLPFFGTLGMKSLHVSGIAAADGML